MGSYPGFIVPNEQTRAWEVQLITGCLSSSSGENYQAKNSGVQRITFEWINLSTYSLKPHSTGWWNLMLRRPESPCVPSFPKFPVAICTLTSQHWWLAGCGLNSGSLSLHRESSFCLWIHVPWASYWDILRPTLSDTAGPLVIKETLSCPSEPLWTHKNSIGLGCLPPSSMKNHRGSWFSMDPWSRVKLREPHLLLHARQTFLFSRSFYVLSVESTLPWAFLRGAAHIGLQLAFLPSLLGRFIDPLRFGLGHGF